MDKYTFFQYLEKAKLDEETFAENLGLNFSVIQRWTVQNKYPAYIEPILKLAIKAKQIPKQKFSPKENIEKALFQKEILKLKAENKKLKEKIKEFTELKKLFLEIEQKSLF